MGYSSPGPTTCRRGTPAGSLGLAMQSMTPTARTVLREFESSRVVSFVLRAGVVTLLAFRTRQGDDHPCCLPSHTCSISSMDRQVRYSRILVITPAPTVRPPSRMANCDPSSRATGTINSTLMFTLSPGITISTPSGKSTDPVTSIVLM
jgi:hypothetical protein